MEQVNSKEYWEELFSSGDCDRFDGDRQSTFFAHVLVESLPVWMNQELARRKWTVMDIGCAEGGGTAVLARRFPSCCVIGVDVSGAAIKRAQEKYPFCQFVQGDFGAHQKVADIVIVSNVLEHMRNSGEHMRAIVSSAHRHAILLHPLNDMSNFEEHFNVFDEEFFPLRIGEYVLSYFKTIDCERRNSACWRGEQILVVYSKECVLAEDRRLSDLFENSEYETLKCVKMAAMAELQGKLEQKEMKALAEEQDHRREVAVLAEKLGEEKARGDNSEDRCNCLQEQLTEQNRQETFLQDALKKTNQIANELREQLEIVKEKERQLQDTLESRNAELAHIKNEKQGLHERLTKSERQNMEALRQLNAMMGSRLFKLVHLVNRISRQALHKDKAERRKFWQWIIGRFRHVPDMDHRYNPLFSVILRLNGQNESPDEQNVRGMHEQMALKEQAELPASICACINSDYNKYPDK